MIKVSQNVYEYFSENDSLIVIDQMDEETVRQLPIAHANNRLMHTNSTHYVLDAAISSIPEGKRQDFIAFAKNYPRVSRFLGPEEGEKEALHFEVPKED